jgi:hypothetical protein
VLWELIAKKRLFRRRNELEAMRAIVSGEIPALTSLRPDVPEALAAVLEKALCRNVEERYQTAREFGQALDRCMTRAGQTIGASEIIAWLDVIFPNRRQERRAHADAAASISDFPDSLPATVRPMLGKIPVRTLVVDENDVLEDAHDSLDDVVDVVDEDLVTDRYRPDRSSGRTRVFYKPGRSVTSVAYQPVEVQAKANPAKQQHAWLATLTALTIAGLVGYRLSGGVDGSVTGQGEPSSPSSTSTHAARAGTISVAHSGVLTADEAARPVDEDTTAKPTEAMDVPLDPVVVVPESVMAEVEPEAAPAPLKVAAKPKTKSASSAPTSNADEAYAGPAPAALTGDLYVPTSGGGAMVRVDGVNRGPAPVRLRLPAGSHTVTITPTGSSHTTTFSAEVSPGRLEVLTVNLSGER